MKSEIGTERALGKRQWDSRKERRDVRNRNRRNSALTLVVSTERHNTTMLNSNPVPTDSRPALLSSVNIRTPDRMSVNGSLSIHSPILSIRQFPCRFEACALTKRLSSFTDRPFPSQQNTLSVTWAVKIVNTPVEHGCARSGFGSVQK